MGTVDWGPRAADCGPPGAVLGAVDWGPRASALAVCGGGGLWSAWSGIKGVACENTWFGAWGQPRLLDGC